MRVIQSLRAPSLRGRFQVLCYHRVGRDDESDMMTTPQWLFAQQMRLISRHYRPMPLGTLVELMSQCQPIPNRAVAVTFDDGYEDTFTRAFPILQSMGIPATVFITTGYVDGSTRPSTLPEAPMLSWEMVKQMRRAGMEIGSHTVTHPTLSQLSADECRQELVASKQRLEAVLQEPVTLFAYPFGHAAAFTDTVQAGLRDAGYRAACTTIPGSNGLEDELLALHRLSPGRRDVASLALQLAELPTDAGLGSALRAGITRRFARATPQTIVVVTP